MCVALVEINSQFYLYMNISKKTLCMGKAAQGNNGAPVEKWYSTKNKPKSSNINKKSTVH